MAVQEPELQGWVKYLEAIFSTLTAGEILSTLMNLGFEHARFMAENCESLHELRDLHQTPEIQDMDGDRFFLYFYGGPPDAEKWFYGTLATWLTDAMLYEFATTDGERAMAVVQDLEDRWDDGEESEWNELE